MAIYMDYGYCKDAREYDHLTAFRKSLKRAGFTYDEVARETEARAVELYGMQCGEPVKFLSPCDNPECLQCKEAYRAYRSGIWYNRTMAACAAASLRRETPLFITLTFPNLVVDASKSDWQAMRKSLEVKRYNWLRSRLEKRLKSGFFVSKDAYDDALREAVWTARHYAKDNVVGEMQKKYGCPVVSVDTGTGMTGIRLKSEHLKVISEHRRDKKAAPLFSLLPSRAGEYSPRLGDYVKSGKLYLPEYPFVRWCFQKWIKRLRNGDNGFPSFRLKYLCFPEVGSSPRDVQLVNVEVDSDPDKRTGRLHYHMVIFLPTPEGENLKSFRQSFKEACRYHWNSVTCSVRFPDSGQYGVSGSGNWFDVARDAGSVSRYVAKYVAKDKLKGERVLSSQGFNWQAAIEDEAYVKRGLNAIKPDADAWQKDYSYVSPYDDREVLPEKIGSPRWVGFDVTSLSDERVEVSDGSIHRSTLATSLAFRSDAKIPFLRVGGVFRCQSPVLHPAASARGMVRTPDKFETMLKDYSKDDLIHSLPAGTRQRLLEFNQYDAVLKNLTWFEYSAVDRYLSDCEIASRRREFTCPVVVDNTLYEIPLPYGFIEGDSGIAQFFTSRFFAPLLKWLHSDVAMGSLSYERAVIFALDTYKERVPSPSVLRDTMHNLLSEIAGSFPVPSPYEVMEVSS